MSFDVINGVTGAINGVEMQEPISQAPADAEPTHTEAK